MNRVTPLKAIRLMCLDCSNGSTHEVNQCPVTDCPVFEYRQGKNPHRKGTGNHSTRAVLVEKSRRELRGDTQEMDFKTLELGHSQRRGFGEKGSVPV